MDDIIEGLVGGLVSSVLGIVLVLGLGAIAGACWLIFKFCEAVLPPFFQWLGDLLTDAGCRLARWWLRVTWKRRMRRALRRAMRDVDTARQDAVDQARLLVAELDREQIPTIDATPTVRVAVRSAVRQA